MVVGALALWGIATRLRLDEAAVQQVRDRARIEKLAHQAPPAAGVGCERARLEAYLEAFSEPSMEDIETAAAATTCLERLADPRSVAPLLELARSGGDGVRPGSDELWLGWESGRVASTLARMGDGVVQEIVGALDDPDAGVRGTAALALVRRASPWAVAALARGVYDPEAGAREAVASVLPELIASGTLSVGRSFELLRRLATDASPHARRGAAAALLLFKGRPARRLASVLSRDPDPGVREAALAARGRLRRR